MHAWAKHHLLQRHSRGGGTGDAGGGGREGEGVGARRVRQGEEALAWALTLAMELFSVQLTDIALAMVRDQAAHHAAEVEAEAEVVVAEAEARAGAGDADQPTHAQRLQRLLAASLPQHAFDKELSRRKLALFFYLVRSPVFDRATLPLLQVRPWGHLPHRPHRISTPRLPTNPPRLLLCITTGRRRPTEARAAAEWASGARPVHAQLPEPQPLPVRQ